MMSGYYRMSYRAGEIKRINNKTYVYVILDVPISSSKKIGNYVKELEEEGGIVVRLITKIKGWFSQYYQVRFEYWELVKKR